MTGPAGGGLEALAERVADEIERTQAFGRPWLRPPAPDGGGPLHSVVVCGAGMSGLAIAFGLRRRGIEDVLVIDQREPGCEGPWATCARMKTLRSPKCLAGPDFGLPSLTPRSWYEAVHGPDAWETLDKIPRDDWMAYLAWYRAATRPVVRNGLRLAGIAADPAGLALTVEEDGRPARIRCRRLVLATGLDGCGGPRIPAVVADLPKRFWTHSAEEGDDTRLRGLDVAVFGSATSSFDWAVTAFENGAASVTMIGRSPTLGRTEVLDWSNFPGYLAHYADLPDLERWRFARLFLGFQVPPTQDQFDRAVAHPAFRMMLGTEIRGIAETAGRLAIETDRGVVTADHILLGTGYDHDLSRREELAAVSGGIATWGDRFTPPPGEADPVLAAHPYLGPGFELTPRSGEDGWLARVHLFNAAALPSVGPVSNGVTGMKFGLPRIVDGVVRGLFAEAVPDLLGDLARFDRQHFDPRGLDRADCAKVHP